MRAEDPAPAPRVILPEPRDLPVGEAEGLEAIEPLEEELEELEELEADAPRVAILMNARSDMAIMDPAEQALTDRGIRCEVRVMSVHDEPDTVADYARNARLRGIKVIIAGAALAAALPGVVAAHTDLPVIGVPLRHSTSVAGGLDALLGISQMPAGAPVACVGIDAARSAGILAARILGI